MPEPVVEINADAAKKLSINNGERVVVESAAGSIELKAEFTGGIHPRVVSIQHGWNNANANILTDDKARDPISGYPAFKGVPCRVLKIES